MIKKTRDFYHIQDQLPLAWQNVKGSHQISLEIQALSERISKIQERLSPLSSDLSEFIDLTTQKMGLLETALAQLGSAPNPIDPPQNLPKDTVEVSLSSSGIGFFSKTFAEEDALIEICLELETLSCDIRMIGTVLESRTSADSENPGYWIRVRFSRDQELSINKLTAHVTQRQIDRLQKSSPETSN